MSRKTIAIIVLIAAIAAIPACQGVPGVTPEQVAQIEQQLKQGRADLALLPAGDPGRIAAEKKIAELERLVAAYKANLEGQVAGGTDNPDASIAAGIQTAAPFLPPPWNAVVLIAGGLLPGVAGWIREASRRQKMDRAGQDLARAIKATAVANGGVLDFTDLTVRESLKSAMPNDARDLVKKSGSNVPLPLVIEAVNAESITSSNSTVAAAA